MVLLAFHELIVKEKKAISDYSRVREGLRDLNSRIAMTWLIANGRDNFTLHQS
jgi:hypothetical protein